MKINHIDHVGIRVTDFTRATRFYEKLGFLTISESLDEHVVEVRHPSGITLNFLDSANNTHDHQNILMDVANKYPGYTHYAMNVDSIEDVVHFLELNQIEITEGPVTFGNGHTSVFVRDPDLNVIEFTYAPAA